MGFKGACVHIGQDTYSELSTVRGVESLLAFAAMLGSWRRRPPTGGAMACGPGCGTPVVVGRELPMTSGEATWRCVAVGVVGPLPVVAVVVAAVDPGAVRVPAACCARRTFFGAHFFLGVRE